VLGEAIRHPQQQGAVWQALPMGGPFQPAVSLEDHPNSVAMSIMDG